MAKVDLVLRDESRLRRRADPADRRVHRRRRRQAAAAGARAARRARVRLRGTDIAYTLAAVVEMIHTATLLHDDVVDESKLRRGHATANATFGNAASVLVGDFLYSRAFQLMVSVGSMRVLEILAQATNVIAEGEVLQLMNTRNPDLDEAAYLKVIQRKTAKLFEAAARSWARCWAVRTASAKPRSPATECTSARRSSSSTTCSTTRAIAARSARTSATTCRREDDAAADSRRRRRASADDAALIRAAIAGRPHRDFTPVMDVLERTGALDYARDRAIARKRSRRGLRWRRCRRRRIKENLLELAAFAARRTY